jgi:hypothetical protein
MKLAEKFAKEAFENKQKLLQEKEAAAKKKQEEKERTFKMFLNTLLPQIEEEVKKGNFKITFTLDYSLKEKIFDHLKEYAKENGFVFAEAEEFSFSMDRVSNRYYISWANG